MLKIKTQNNCFSEYREKLMKKHLRKWAPIILGEKNLKQIKGFDLVMYNNFNDRGVGYPFYNMWNGSRAVLSIAPNWMYGKREGTREYGVMHELVHLRDIIEGRLIPEKPKRGEKMRIWWEHDDGYHYLGLNWSF